MMQAPITRFDRQGCAAETQKWSKVIRDAGIKGE
jgi:hypothetical protein